VLLIVSGRFGRLSGVRGRCWAGCGHGGAAGEDDVVLLVERGEQLAGGYVAVA